MANPEPLPEVPDYIMLLLVLQHLIDRDFVETARSLGRESGIHFCMRHFEELILGSCYEEAEDYIHSFTSVEENRFSTKIIFDIKKLKLFKALDNARHFAREIVRNEFPQFTEYNDQIYAQAMQLVTTENYREHPAMSQFEKTAARSRGLREMQQCIRANPAFRGKLELPPLRTNLRRMFMFRAQRQGQGLLGVFPFFMRHQPNNNFYNTD